VNLGDGVNSKTGEWNLYVSPDESYIIFEASGRKTNLSVPGDLYFAVRKNGSFGQAVNMKELNTAGSNLMPCVSPDRKSLYFSSSPDMQSGSMNIYRVDLSKLVSKYIGETEKNLKGKSSSGERK
jgi:Tol biopolymer transport system component